FLLSAALLLTVSATTVEENPFVKVIRLSLTETCQNITQFDREDILGECYSLLDVFPEEIRENLTVLVPVMATHLHVLIDLFEESKEAGETLDKFKGRCDHNVAEIMIDNSTTGLEAQNKAFKAKVWKKLQEICPTANKTKHDDVRKIVGEIAKGNVATDGENEIVLIRTRQLFHLLIVAYEMEKENEVMDDDFVKKCKDIKALLDFGN
ncbi:hypothetical protein PFISCL1PPCAC_14385, partial [Pristionchus fissidentatus]